MRDHLPNLRTNRRDQPPAETAAVECIGHVVELFSFSSSSRCGQYRLALKKKQIIKNYFSSFLGSFSFFLPSRGDCGDSVTYT